MRTLFTGVIRIKLGHGWSLVVVVVVVIVVVLVLVLLLLLLLPPLLLFLLLLLRLLLMTIGYKAGHYCHFRVLRNANSDTGRKKTKRKMGGG